MTARTDGKLYYHGTAEDVRLGDRVRIRRLMRKPLSGVVCHIPGESPPHPEMIWEDGVGNWAIRLEDGSLIGWIFLPDEVQPSKRIELISRGEVDGYALRPTEEFR